MSAPLDRSDRFRGDLWNTTHRQREKIARALMASRGYRVVRVDPIASGLYVTVTVYQADSHEAPAATTIGATELAAYVWKVTR